MQEIKVGQVWAHRVFPMGECEVTKVESNLVTLRDLKQPMAYDTSRDKIEENRTLVTEQVPAVGQVWNHASRGSIVVKRFDHRGIEGVDFNGRPYSSDMSCGLEKWINHYGWSLAEPAVPIAVNQVWKFRKSGELATVLSVSPTSLRIRSIKTGVTMRTGNDPVEFVSNAKYLGELPVAGDVWVPNDRHGPSFKIERLRTGTVDTRTVGGTPFSHNIATFVENHRKVIGAGASAAEVGTAAHKSIEAQVALNGDFENVGKSIAQLVSEGYLVPTTFHMSTGAKDPIPEADGRRYFSAPQKGDKFYRVQSGHVVTVESLNPNSVKVSRKGREFLISPSELLDRKYYKPLPGKGEVWVKGKMMVSIRAIGEDRVHTDKGSTSIKRFVNEYKPARGVQFQQTLGRALRPVKPPYNGQQLQELNEGSSIQSASKWFKELKKLRACNDPVVASRTKSRIAYAEKRLGELLGDQPQIREDGALVIDFAKEPSVTVRTNMKYPQVQNIPTGAGKTVVLCAKHQRQALKASVLGFEYTGSTLADMRGQVKDGYQFLGIDQQMEHFKGCVYVASHHAIRVPSGSLYNPYQFRAMYGGFHFAMDGVGEKISTNAWEVFTESRGIRFPRVEKLSDLPKGEST